MFLFLFEFSKNGLLQGIQARREEKKEKTRVAEMPRSIPKVLGRLY